MDIIEAVFARVRPRVFPVTYDRLRSLIVDMVQFQLRRLGPLTALRRQQLIERIVQTFVNAMAPEHEPVGVNAALTTGENLVQSSLGAKHTAGIKRGATGYDRIEEITDMKNESDIVKVITKPVMGVPRPKEEISQLANIIIRVDLNDIAQGYDLVDAPAGTTPLIERLPPWYRVSIATRAIGVGLLSTRWLRIYVDANLMYKHRITLPSIAMTLADELSDRGVVMYPPTVLGTYLDIHVPADRTDADILSRLGSLLGLQVGGIGTVENAYPIFENLLTNLRINEVDQGTYELVSAAPTYVPAYAWSYMISAMVPDAQFVGNSGRRFTTAYSYQELRHIILEVPLMYSDVLRDRSEPDAEGRVTLYFREELADEYPYLQHADLSPITLNTVEEADSFLLENMVEFHFYWYIEAVCSHVQDLFLLPEVDGSRTFTTSPLDCMASLGYLAMRQMIYSEFKNNISVDPAHIKTIINNMTLYKEPVSIRRQSLKNDKSEWMTYTTFEDVLKYVVAAAFAGEIDHMQSVSSKILTGAKITIGKGGDNLPPVSPQNPTGNRFLEMKLQQQRREQARQGTQRTGRRVPRTNPGTNP